jgi:hypothetical protein
LTGRIFESCLAGLNLFIVSLPQGVKVLLHTEIEIKQCHYQIKLAFSEDKTLAQSCQGSPEIGLSRLARATKGAKPTVGRSASSNLEPFLSYVVVENFSKF